MLDSTSRYAPLAVKTLPATGPDGQSREIRYVARRFLPPADDGPTAFEHTVTQGDRLDNITAKYLGDPTQFWRVADANNAMDPADLTETPGRSIRITIPNA